jgi:hypothetical protein
MAPEMRQSSRCSSPLPSCAAAAPHGSHGNARTLYHSNAMHAVRMPNCSGVPSARIDAPRQPQCVPAQRQRRIAFRAAPGRHPAPHVRTPDRRQPRAACRRRTKPRAQSEARARVVICMRASGARVHAPASSSDCSRTSPRGQRDHRSSFRGSAALIASLSARASPRQRCLSGPPRGSCWAAPRAVRHSSAVLTVRKRKRGGVPSAPLGAPKQAQAASASPCAQRQRQTAFRTVPGRHPVPHAHPLGCRCAPAACRAGVQNVTELAAMLSLRRRWRVLTMTTYLLIRSVCHKQPRLAAPTAGRNKLGAKS